MTKNTATSETLTPEPSPQMLTITFELVAEEKENSYALINTIGQETAIALQGEGYIASLSIYSGQKGMESFLIDFLLTIQQITTNVWDNHAAIAEGIADLSGLVTIFGGILPILKHLRDAHTKHTDNKSSLASPIKMTVEINGKLLVIEASEITQADAALKLALKYFSMHSTVATQAAKSKLKVRGQVPTHKRRARR